MGHDRLNNITIVSLEFWKNKNFWKTVVCGGLLLTGFIKRIYIFSYQGVHRDICIGVKKSGKPIAVIPIFF